MCSHLDCLGYESFAIQTIGDRPAPNRSRIVGRISQTDQDVSRAFEQCVEKRIDDAGRICHAASLVAALIEGFGGSASGARVRAADPSRRN
jgi:hypothetical protein